MVQARALLGAAVVSFMTLGSVSAWAADGSAGMGGESGAASRVPTHVACIGDSITAGVGAAQGKPYVTDLQTLLGPGIKVQGFGHIGATMQSNSVPPTVPYEAQPDYPAATDWVSAAGPDAVVDVVIMLGTNDAQPQNWTGDASAAQYKSDYIAMIQRFAALNTRPLVFLALPPTSYTDGVPDSTIANKIIPIIKQIAADTGLPTIDVHTATGGHPEAFAADGLHPDDSGHLLIAQAMYQSLLNTSAVPVIPTGAAGSPGSAGGSASSTGGGASSAAGGANSTGSSAGAAGLVGSAGSTVGSVAGGPSVGAGGGALANAPGKSADNGGCSIQKSKIAPQATAPWLALGFALLLGMRRRKRTRMDASASGGIGGEPARPQ